MQINMKVLVAHITSECNEHISHVADLDAFLLLYGDDCIKAMHIKDIFEEKNIELVPAIFASLHPSGMIKHEAFDFIANKIINTIRDNINEIDGIYLQLHGASGIKNLDEVSGEHYLIKKIREIVGQFMPIAVVMDPHGNITEELTNNVNLVRCYRESPHSDQVDTERLVAKKFINLLENRREMKPIIRKLPIMVGGERSVSAKEPMLTINTMLDEAEKDPRVFSDSYHIGYIRHDDDKLGAAVVVVPNTPQDIQYCEKVADEISAYAWEHRKEFKFSGNFDEPSESIKKAISFVGKTAVITDSGDNCGAGGAGQNTVILRELLKSNLCGKKVLIAGINDPQTHSQMNSYKIGDHISIDLGVGEDELSAPVHIEGTLKQIGEEMYGLGVSHVVGKAYTVNVDSTFIDVIILNRNIQYGNMDQFHKAGLEFHNYDIVVVKMGYLDTYLVPETSYHIMALTDGPTIQRSEKIPFKRIYRPMWPIDDFDSLRYID
ncbi:M81 family metallopeptidase [Paratissierella segnis]|jgi:microcystin degradation protein MlrC|nr:M81 family metallopeptidase [Paratissierella segnis]